MMYKANPRHVDTLRDTVWVYNANDFCWSPLVCYTIEKNINQQMTKLTSIYVLNDIEIHFLQNIYRKFIDKVSMGALHA